MVKTHKISNWVFILLIVATIVVFGLFFGVGYDNMEGKYVAPEHTGTLMYFMYAMAAICVLSAVIGAAANTISSFGGPKGVNKTGVPTTAISIISLVILIGSVIASYTMASAEPLVLPSGKIFDDATLLVLTDTMVYTLYALMVFATIGLIVNLSGIFRK